MIPVFRQIGTRDRDLNRLQTAIDKVFSAITGKQILDGRLIEDQFIDVSEGALSINHGLGYAPRGWIVVKKDANADIYAAAASDTPRATLDLTATADVTVSLWVF